MNRCWRARARPVGGGRTLSWQPPESDEWRGRHVSPRAKGNRADKPACSLRLTAVSHFIKNPVQPLRCKNLSPGFCPPLVIPHREKITWVVSRAQLSSLCIFTAASDQGFSLVQILKSKDKHSGKGFPFAFFRHLITSHTALLEAFISIA